MYSKFPVCTGCIWSTIHIRFWFSINIVERNNWVVDTVPKWSLSRNADSFFKRRSFFCSSPHSLSRTPHTHPPWLSALHSLAPLLPRSPPSLPTLIRFALNFFNFKLFGNVGSWWPVLLNVEQTTNYQHRPAFAFTKGFNFFFFFFFFKKKFLRVALFNNPWPKFASRQSFKS